MGRKTWIDSDIWRDMRKDPIEVQMFYLRLLCSENGNIAGYFKIDVGHLAYDMRTDEDEVIALLTKKTKYWKYDKETEQVLIPRYTKHNAVKSPPQINKLNAELSKLTPCKLHGEFIKAFAECNGIGAETLLDPKFLEKAKPYINI